jgi:hypothetical protein
MGSVKKQDDKPSTGIIIVACLNFLFALAAFVLGSMALSSSILLAVWLYLKGAVLFVSGIGLWKLRFWAWLLTVTSCSVGLVEFAFYPNAIPLELIVLPYLLIKRKGLRRQARDSFF